MRKTTYVSVISTKGGVGKTTVCASMSALLADLGYRVLMVDADVQPSLSDYYEIQTIAPGGIVDVIQNLDVHDDFVSRTTIDNLDIVRSNDGDGSTVLKLMNQWMSPEMRLSRALRKPGLDYDYVFIDSQGAAGPLQDMAILPADILISPLEPTTLSVKEFFRGTAEIIDRIRSDPEHRIASVPLYILTNRQTRTRVSKELRNEIAQTQFADSHMIRVLENGIPAAKSYEESPRLRMPPHRIEPARNGGQMKSASAALHHIVWEIWPHLAGQTVPGSDADQTKQD